MSNDNMIMHDPDNILEVSHLKKYFPIKGGFFGGVTGNVKAVDDVSFSIKRGTTMGLVGESGCGKSTTGRTILRLIEKTEGTILFNGEDVSDVDKKKLRELRTKMQIIFQDPYSSLSPRLPIGEIIGEAVKEHNIVPKNEYDAYISQVMKNCGLQDYHKDRYPHEFSGGQRQRICIARALALNPEFIVCDEPISALDVSIQSQVVNMLEDMQEEMGLTYLFIAHDLSVVRHISNRIGVMYLGTMVELAESYELNRHPIHPYTKTLLSAVPVPDPKLSRSRQRIVLEGDIPSPMNPPKGCRFHTRCPYATDRCREQVPVFKEYEPEHWAACHLLEE